MSDTIKLEPDFNLLKEYLPLVQEKLIQTFHQYLLKIPDFDNKFCDLLDKYKLLPHLSEVYYFAGLYAMKIENLNKKRTFNYFKNTNEYLQQYYELKELIYNPKPESIVLKFFEDGMTINNPILIEEILIAFSKLPKPIMEPNFKTAREETFRSIFLKDTKQLFNFIKDNNKTTKNKHKFICELLELIGFDWTQIKGEPILHLKRKYKE